MKLKSCKSRLAFYSSSYFPIALNLQSKIYYESTFELCNYLQVVKIDILIVIFEVFSPKGTYIWDFLKFQTSYLDPVFL